MDTTQSQWPQGIGVIEVGGARKARPEKDEALKCPRCSSTNTKFCYYNNYSLSQPRYFCKTCRRYWTAGGSLRNVPVGGGSRKNKRSSSSPLPPSSKIKHDHVPHHLDQNPSKIQFQGQDLNLAHPHDHNPNNTTCANTTTATSSSMELFKTGIAYNSFVSDSSTMYPNALNFSLENGVESTTGARLLFPFEDSNSRGQGESTALGYWSGMLGGGSW